MSLSSYRPVASLARCCALAFAGLFPIRGLADTPLPMGNPDIVVDQTADTLPNGCTAGACSLREAVILANARPGADRIVVPAGDFALSRAGADEDEALTGDLDVFESLEIVGAGATQTSITQLSADRVLDARGAGTALVVRQLGVQGGSGVDEGGGIRARGVSLTLEDAAVTANLARVRGGGVYHHDGSGAAGPFPLTIRRTLFEDNYAFDAVDEDAVGGALYSIGVAPEAGPVTIEASTFTDNHASRQGGALALQALNAFTVHHVRVIDTAFTGNAAERQQGGAIVAGRAEGGVGIVGLIVRGATFTGNAAETVGGAIAATPFLSVSDSTFSGNTAVAAGAIDSTGTLSVNDATFCDNDAVTGGGAVRVAGDDVAVQRSTFCNNVASTTDAAHAGGGALLVIHGGADSAVRVERSTFVGNSALRGAAVAVAGRTVHLVGNTITRPTLLPAGASGAAVRFTSTDATDSLHLVSNILHGDCSYPLIIVPDVALSNLEATGDTCKLASAGVSAENAANVTVAALNLGPLTDHGGLTATRLPLPGSLAIDDGWALQCGDSDQRGYDIVDGLCDIGAVEASGTPPFFGLFADGFE